MLIALSIIQTIFLIGAIALMVYWLAVAYHVKRTSRNLPTARQGLALPEALAIANSGGPRVCVIIPAHNEAATITPLARSLKAQTYRPLRVVFSLDRCTDDTRAVLQREIGDDPRIEILEVSSWADGWAGKVNAIWRAVTDSKGSKDADLLLFVDADTALDPECIRATVAILQSRRLGMLSLLSTMTHDRWFENVVQPAAGMELMRQYPLERANLDRGRRAFANGQYILITREAYTAIGGHEAVHSALLEDMEIARLCEKMNIRAGLFMADAMHVCRMYASFDAFARGWKRIYIECANRRVSRLASLSLRTRLLGVALPLSAFAAIISGVIGIVIHPDELAWACIIFGPLAIAAMLISLVLAYRLGNVPIRHVWSYPIGAWITGGILREAARDLREQRPTIWGGREYIRPAR